MYLTPEIVGGAELTLGGFDQSKVSGNFTIIERAGSTSHWVLTSTGIAVNGKSPGLLASPKKFIMDSGDQRFFGDIHAVLTYWFRHK